MKTQTCHHAKLGVGESQERLQEDDDQGKDRAEDRNNGDGEDRLIGLRLDGTGNAHDSGSAADAVTAGRQESQRVIDAQQAGDHIIERDHNSDDEDGRFETLQTGAHEDDQVQHEPQENNAGAEEFVRDESRAFPRQFSDGLTKLDDHAQNESQDKMTDQRKTGQTGQCLTDERTGQRENEADDSITLIGKREYVHMKAPYMKF